MADGRCIPSLGLWTGKVTAKGVSREGTFEVFNSNGAWAMLFGKPLLKAFNVVHDYTEDIIRIPRENGMEWVVLTNQFANAHNNAAKLLANLTVDIKQIAKIPILPSEQVKKVTTNLKTKVRTQKSSAKMFKPSGGLTTPLEGSPIHHPHVDTEQHPTDIINSSDIANADNCERSLDDNWRSVWLLDEAAGGSPIHPGIEQPDATTTFEPTLLTRMTDPHNPARVRAILSEITIGQDLMPEQVEHVQRVISKHAECFALSMSEVTPVIGAAHNLDIPRDKQFKTKDHKVHRRRSSSMA